MWKLHFYLGDLGTVGLLFLYPSEIGKCLPLSLLEGRMMQKQYPKVRKKIFKCVFWEGRWKTDQNLNTD